jgi:hypothetical protein
LLLASQIYWSVARRALPITRLVCRADSLGGVDAFEPFATRTHFPDQAIEGVIAQALAAKLNNESACFVWGAGDDIANVTDRPTGIEANISG